MTRTGSRELGIALTALVIAAAPAAHAKIVGYSCTEHKQIASGDILGTLKIDKEITLGTEDCVKACAATKGCVAINVKEKGEITYCQMFGKVTGVKPYPIGADGDGTWGFACVNNARVKWHLPKPGEETFTAKPQFPMIGDPNGQSSQDANRPNSAPSIGNRR